MRNNSIYKIALREFKRIRERKTLFLFEIVFPIIFFFLFAEIYETELIRNIPVAIYDADNSSLSRTITRYIDSSPTLTIKQNCRSIDEIESEFQKGNIQGAFVFPQNFEKNIKSGKSSNLVVYKNSTNILIGTYLLKEASTIGGIVSGGALLKKLQGTGLTKEKAMSVVNPIRIETSSLYNPNYSYERYLMPGVLLFTFQLMIILIAVILVSSEYTHHTLADLIKLSGNKAYKIVAGKIIPHLFLHSASAVLIFGIIFPMYGLSNNGSTINLLILMGVFVFSSFMIGLFVSAWVEDQILATEIAILLNTPAFILSGLTFPTWGMPEVYQQISQTIPFTHFLNGFLKVYQMGGTFGDIKIELLILFLFGIVSLVGTIIGLHLKMQNQNSDKNILIKAEL